MTLRELINDLTDLEAEHGDVKIFVQDCRSGVVESLGSAGFVANREWIDSIDAGDIINYNGDKAIIISVG